MYNKLKKKASSLFQKEKYYTNYYERILSKYSDLNTYLTLFEKCDARKHIITREKIHYSSGLEFGSTIKKVKKNNFPHYVIEHLDEFTVLLYRIMIGGHKAKLEMHFYKNTLFFFNYSFSYLTDVDKENIIEVLAKKYLGNTLNFDTRNQNITDDFNNHILVENGIDFVIHYITLEGESHNSIRKIKEREKKNQSKKMELRQKELYSKL
jgi:hypothetical protein